MKYIVAMDESGNTQEKIAVGLVGIPHTELPKITSILSLSERDPVEISVLYTKKSVGEFKYTDLRNAFRQTQLDVYDAFLRRKLGEINMLRVQVYLSVFPNPRNNEERMGRLLRESEDLLHKWAHQNQEDALSRDLEIKVDQQVFPEPYTFQYMFRRGKYCCSLFRTRDGEPASSKKVYADRGNVIPVKDANSKTHKEIH